MCIVDLLLSVPIMSIITLLTDFGTDDEYVGVMKGAILMINPSATIVDITHNLDPQDIPSAAHLIRSYYRYFPRGTIHLTIVDPGVGSDRKIIALTCRGQTFLSPDNGLLTFLMNEEPVDILRYVENSDLFMDPVSRTFHGRDIFAPVAAHLSLGLDIETVGTLADPCNLLQLQIPEPRDSGEGKLVGVVIWIDRFGNLITNVSDKHLQRLLESRKGATLRFRISSRLITGLSRSYADAKAEEPLATTGSRGYLEIAVNGGNARDILGAAKGDPVEVMLSD
jgi:S-adenosylmethionine hydrolase